MKKFFISIIFLPIFCFSQKADTIKITNGYQNYLNSKKEKYLDYKGNVYKLIDLDSIKWNFIDAKIVFEENETESEIYELKIKIKDLQKQITDNIFLYLKLEREIEELKENKK